MAQDFHKAFGLGDDETSIASIDADGVALAGLKAQQGIIDQQQAEILSLRQRIAILEKLILPQKLAKISDRHVSGSRNISF